MFKILNSQSRSITWSALLLGLSSVVSAFLGLFRDRLMAGRFGAGEELDIYFAAFRLPDFVYALLITGGLVAAFLPVFADHWRRGEKNGWHLTNNVLNSFFILLAGICFILFLFVPSLVKIVAPGFNASQLAVTAQLTRIMLLSPILFGLSNILAGVLQYFQKFFSYALAPILYNLGIIFGIIFLEPIFGLYGLAYGVLLGALLHLLIYIPPMIVSGFSYQILIDWKDRGLKKIFRLMAPRMLAQASSQINMIVMTAIASTLAIGSITVFTFANNLQGFPVAIIGVSFAVAAFPSMSRSVAEDNQKDFFKHFSRAWREISFLVIPASIFLFLLRAQAVRLVLGTGSFSWQDTRLTAAALGIFCLGIFFASIIPLLARSFFSYHNTKTPTVISIFSIIMSILLAFVFLFLLKQDNGFTSFLIKWLKLYELKGIEILALPLALVTGSFLNASLLFIFIFKKLRQENWLHIFYSLIKIIFSSLIAGLVVLTILRVPMAIDTFKGLLIQTLLAGIAGLMSFLLLTILLKCQEICIRLK